MREAPSAASVGDRRDGGMDLFTHMLIGYLIGWLSAFTVAGYNEYLILIPVVMAMLPAVAVYLAMQKQIASGITEGALKG